MSIKRERLPVPDMLDEAKATFIERAALYGNNYNACAIIMQVLFPDGVKLVCEEDFLRFQFLEHVVGKLTRYANQFNNRGHHDSIMDLAVYAFMLAAADDRIKKERDKT